MVTAVVKYGIRAKMSPVAQHAVLKLNFSDVVGLQQHAVSGYANGLARRPLTCAAIVEDG